MNDITANPCPDQVALAAVGAQVRARLDSAEGVYRAPVEGADLWTAGEFLSDEQCERLIAMIDAAAEPSGVLNHGTTEIWRTSYSANFDRSDPFVQEIEQRFEDLLGLPNVWSETIQGQRYHPGQMFRDHLDAFWTNADYWPDEVRRGGQRSITAMVYLNDVAAGGETEFPHLRASIPPQKGVIVVWDNSAADGTVNPRTLHAGREVREGVKYIITKWYRTRPWGEPA